MITTSIISKTLSSHLLPVADMSKNISQFRFKQFSVFHHRSAMKVGVDGVLVGAWADVDGAASILDVGTGCGLIALMMAQRKQDAHIWGIDIDLPSVEEATENVLSSPWSDRITILHSSFPFGDAQSNVGLSPKFDLIISNPPFFDSGVSNPDTPRERARHQASLSPAILLSASVSSLNPGGSIAMIVPADLANGLEAMASSLGYRLSRKCLVRGNTSAPIKRALLQWTLNNSSSSVNYPQSSILTIEAAPGIPTPEYRSLCRHFYLKF